MLQRDCQREKERERIEGERERERARKEGGEREASYVLYMYPLMILKVVMTNL